MLRQSPDSGGFVELVDTFADKIKDPFTSPLEINELAKLNEEKQDEWENIKKYLE